MAALSFDDLLEPTDLGIPEAAKPKAPTTGGTGDVYRFENLSRNQLLRAQQVLEDYDINRRGLLLRPDAAELFNQQPIEKRKAFFTEITDLTAEKPEIKPVQERKVEPVVTPKAAPAAAPTPSAAVLTFDDLVPQEQKPQKEEKKTAFTNLTKPNNLKVIEEAAVARYGESGKRRKNESEEDYVKRWAFAMRLAGLNTINATQELNWVYNAPKQDVLKLAKAYELWDSVPSWWEEGGQSGVRPFFEALAAGGADVGTLAGFGVGAAARYKAARVGFDIALKSRLKTAGAGAAIEGTIGVAESAITQNVELELKKKQDKDRLEKLRQQDRISQEEYEEYAQEVDAREISKTEAALSGVLSAVAGVFDAGVLARKGKGISTKQELENELSSRRLLSKTPVKTEKDVAEDSLVKAFSDQQEDIAARVAEGRTILNDLSLPTDVTEAAVKSDFERRAVKVAEYILLNDPAYAVYKKEIYSKQRKVGDVVMKILDDVDKIDDVVLERALLDAGINPSEFARANRTTLADAGKIMQSYSTLSKLVTKAVNVDPEAEKLLKDFAKAGEVEEGMGAFRSAILRLERESKAFVVGAPGVTMRNIIGTSIGMTFQSASRLLEGTVYTVGKSTKNLITGNVAGKPVEKSMNDFVKDAFAPWVYLTNQGITSEIVDEVLKFNPKVKEQIFSALQETGNDKLTWLAKFVNKGNLAQDVLFRRALFTASMERQLRDVGLNMFEILAKGQVIPADVVKNAADDALKGTFSYMPKTGATNAIVRGLERLPGASLVVPFPRFMANAMAFQVKYMPVFSGYKALDQTVRSLSAVAKKDPQRAEAMWRKATQSYADTAIGMSVLLAAYNYRAENQDLKWNEVRSFDVNLAAIPEKLRGEDAQIFQQTDAVIDTRAIFPLAPALWLGDFMYQVFNAEGSTAKTKMKEGFETIVGLKAPSGTTMIILEGFPEVLEALKGIFEDPDFESKEVKKVQEEAGKVVGSFLTRFINPTTPISDFLSLFRKESMVARDPNVLEGDNKFLDAIENQFYAKVAGLKEELPATKPRLREEPIVRAGGFLSQLIGIRFQPGKNRLEKELETLGLEDYKLFSPSGDKIIDRAVIDAAIPEVINYIPTVLDSEDYKRMSNPEKKETLKNTFSRIIQTARTQAEATMLSSKDQKEMVRVFANDWNKLSQDNRTLINKLHKDKYGVSLDKALADDPNVWTRILEYKEIIKQYQR